MKKAITTFLFCTFIFYLNAQVFVKHDASGSNNGSNWANAYQSLDKAITNSAAGSILWIAAGVYTPGEATKSFTISKKLTIYGGFKGDEAQLDQRKVFDNHTILSGDNKGDDGNDLTKNGNDNSYHVLEIQSSEKVVVDGVHITGGRGKLDGAYASDEALHGGGALVQGEVEFHQCYIRDNLAGYGGGIHINSSKEGVWFNQCRFETNYCNFWGGAVYAGNANTNVKFSECEFVGNVGETGGAVIAGGTGTQITVEKSVFNDNFGQFGGGIYIDDQAMLTLNTNNFIGNTAQYGGAIYVLDGAKLTANACLFEKNTGIGTDDDPIARGGAVLGKEAEMTMNQCTFKENQANQIGGGLHLELDSYAKLIRCSFNKNQTSAAGGALSLLDGSMVDIENCGFSENVSLWGGAIYHEGTTDLKASGTSFLENEAHTGGVMNAVSDANSSFKDCRFNDNFASFSGGAMEVTGMNCMLKIEECEFLRNIADTTAGAVGIWGGAVLEARQCEFSDNRARNYWAGAVWLASSEVNVRHKISRCKFINNHSLHVAGALYCNDAKVDLENTLFANNMATGDGIGGAISYNYSDGTPDSLNMVHCSFFQNSGNLAGGIAQWSSGSNICVVTATNCIWDDQQNSWAKEAGNVKLVSSGGNICKDQSMDSWFSHPKDQKNTDPKILNSKAIYGLLSESPAINAGVATDVKVDINGDPRDSKPDAGAHEVEGSSAIDKLAFAGVIAIIPNPVSTNAVLEVENDWRGDLRIQVYNISGQICLDQVHSKTDHRFHKSLNMNNMIPGSYTLLLHYDRYYYRTSFIKQ